MKHVLCRCVVGLLLLASAATLAPCKSPAEELSLVVTIVTGERGRDSNSTTTTLTLTGDKLSYQQSYHGAHAGGQAPVKKEYRVSATERDELISSLRNKNLLVTRTLAALPPNDEPQSYFSLLIRSKLEGKEHLITIRLPRTAPKVKSDRLYQDSIAVVEQLYLVIRKTDTGISMPELIH